jgi:hypothetical protein
MWVHGPLSPGINYKDTFIIIYEPETPSRAINSGALDLGKFHALSSKCGLVSPVTQDPCARCMVLVSLNRNADT